MGELSLREKSVLKKLKIPGRFYVIGTFKSDKKLDLEVKKHEIAHALFYLDNQYRRNVENILKTIDCRRIHRYIKNLGYHKEVFVDETHAYLITDFEDLAKAKIPVHKFINVKEKLERNFNQYLTKYI